MENKILGSLKLNKGKEVKINYESLKNYMKFEDIFYELHLVPLLKEMGLEHRFEKEFIILKKK